MAVTGFPKRQLVGEDIDSCEAPLDDSREPRFPVMDAVGPNHGGGLHQTACLSWLSVNPLPATGEAAPSTPSTQ